MSDLRNAARRVRSVRASSAALARSPTPTAVPTVAAAAVAAQAAAAPASGRVGDSRPRIARVHRRQVPLQSPDQDAPSAAWPGAGAVSTSRGSVDVSVPGLSPRHPRPPTTAAADVHHVTIASASPGTGDGATVRRHRGGRSVLPLAAADAYERGFPRLGGHAAGPALSTGASQSRFTRIRGSASRAAGRLRGMSRKRKAALACIGSCVCLMFVWQLHALAGFPLWGPSAYGARLLGWLGSLRRATPARYHHTTDEEVRSNLLFDGPATSAALGPQELQGGSLMIATSPHMCRNTVQGFATLVDDRGRTCARDELDYATGCCPNATDTAAQVPQYSCGGCDLSTVGCCSTYEQCVSCCLHPARHNRLEELKARGVGHRAYATMTSAFEFCTFKCRTSSGSVVYENSYRNEQHYCMGSLCPVLTPGFVSVNAIAPSDAWMPPLAEGLVAALNASNANAMLLQQYVRADPYISTDAGEVRAALQAVAASLELSP